MPVFFSILTFFSTLGGGVFALRHRSSMHLLLGFTAGVLLGVVTFDVLPEIMRGASESGIDPDRFMGALVVGFLLFHSLEKLLLKSSSCNDKHPLVGQAAALALAVHSFFDGFGIGLAFQMSRAVGILVAMAVVTHDFADGLNTVNLSLMHHNGRTAAWRLLLLDAVAPVLGAASTLVLHPGQAVLLGYLAFLTGFLLYISASEILPEAHRERPSMGALGMTLVGVVFIFCVARLV